MELRHVKNGEIIDHVYLTVIIVEARFRNYPMSKFITTDYKGAAAFNQIVDWLASNYPSEFEVVK